MEQNKRRNSEEMTRTLSLQPISSSASIQSLPQELLVRIFSNLSLGEICNTVAKVCKDWEKLHWDSELYNVSMDNIGEATTEQLLMTCLIDAQLLASPYYDSKSIKNIIIEKSSENHNTPKLHQMETRTYRFVSKFEKDIIKMVSHLSQVTLIHLPDNYSSEAIAGFLSYCVQLEELKLYGNFGSPVVRNPALIALCEKLCGTLRVLHVDCVSWDLNAVNAIYRCRLLDDLAIREANYLSTECLLVIAEMSTLRRLQIYHCCTPDASDWISMISNDNLKDLTCLHLEDCSYNDDVAVAIGTNLKNLTELTIFTRMPCKPAVKRYVANKGLEAIIKGCSQLTKLELSFGGWGDRQLAKILLTIPEYLPRLKRLSAIPMNTSIKWMTKLRTKMPELLMRKCFSAEFE